METVNIGDTLKSKKDVQDIFTRSIGKASKSADKKVNSCDHEYDGNNSFRGLAVIISNGNFKSSVTRAYCDDELTRMAETFGNHVLNFTIVAFKDLTVKQMEWVFDSASDQKEFHQKSDCFVCVIGSHGSENPRPQEGNSQSAVYYRDHCLYGVHDLTITTKSIIERFCNVDELENKPKIFFFQACRSEMGAQTDAKVDLGHEVEVRDTPHSNQQLGIPGNNSCRDTDQEHTDVTEGRGIKEEFLSLIGKFRTKPKEIIRILYPPCDDDCLIVYSSSSEKSSYGRDKVGGWMLYSLHDTIKQHLGRIKTKQQSRIDIMSVLIDMSRFASERFETKLPENTKYPKRKSTVVFEHRLHKELYFC